MERLAFNSFVLVLLFGYADVSCVILRFMHYTDVCMWMVHLIHVEMKSGRVCLFDYCSIWGAEVVEK